MMNILNGGKHADNNVDFQEFMIMPLGAPTFPRGAAHRRGDLSPPQEAAARSRPLHRRRRRRRLRPDLKSSDEALEVLAKAIEKAGYKLGDHVVFALDPAATELFDEAKKKGKPATASSRASRSHRQLRRDDRPLEGLCDKWPIRSIEDGLAEDDWDGLAEADRRAGRQGAAGGRRPVRHQHEAPATRASTRTRPTASW